jgi:replicative DNA helicase
MSINPRQHKPTPQLPEGTNVPANDKAEDGIIGGILRWPAVLPDIAAELHPDDFRQDFHQRVYRAMLDMQERRATIDMVSVYSWMNQRGQIVGDNDRVDLARVWDAMPTGAHTAYYATLVMEASRLRSLAFASWESMQDALRPTAPTEEIIEAAERRLFAIADRRAGESMERLRSIIPQVLERMDARAAKGSAAGVATGLTDLDE